MTRLDLKESIVAFHRDESERVRKQLHQYGCCWCSGDSLLEDHITYDSGDYVSFEINGNLHCSFITRSTLEDAIEGMKRYVGFIHVYTSKDILSSNRVVISQERLLEFL